MSTAIKGKVTISGSMRFFEEMLNAASTLQREGYITYVPFPDGRDGSEIPEDVKRLYDEEHMQKISDSDFLFVVNVGGYIGNATRREIEYAESIGKVVIYLEESGSRTENMRRELKNIMDAMEVLYEKYKFPVLNERNGGDRPNIITLIGSRKYQDVIDQMVINLSLEGSIVFSPISNCIDMSKMNEDQIGILHEVHYQKMLMSDQVLVVNVDGYIGQDTQREIDFAIEHGINVEYYQDPDEYMEDENNEDGN